MPEDIRPLKRAHSEEESSVASGSTRLTLQNLKRNEELWFDDGNLILIARGTCFRIYRGLLASQSTVFSDMLLSSTTSAEETLDGCPTVNVSDSPEDLAHFLRVLLPCSQKRFYCREADTALPFNEVSAIIRLAHKYHVADIHNQALLLLQDYYFPSNLDRYDELRRLNRVHREYAIAAINLARLTDTPTLLPGALLKCCSLQDAIFDGQKREDGTIEHLPSDDLRRCFIARTALVERNFQVMASVFRSAPSETCQDREHCVRVLDARCCSIVREGVIFKHSCPINWTKSIKLAVGSGICPKCEKELQTRNTRERRKFWDDLPTIFKITVEGWPSRGAAS